MKRIWKESDASYTVEAAFVVPIVLGIVFVILYSIFLQHDRVILRANLENLIFLLAEEDIEKKEYDNYLSKGLWILKLEKTTIKNNKIMAKGTVKGEAVMQIPVLNMLMSGKQAYSVSETCYKIQPEEILRYGPDFLNNQKKETNSEWEEND